MTIKPRVFDLRGRDEWNQRTLKSSRKIFPWREMRDGDQIILPVCLIPGKPKHQFTKNARSSLMTYLKSKPLDLLLKVEPLEPHHRKGVGYLCTVTKKKDEDAWKAITPKHDWSSVKVGDVVTFSSDDEAQAEAFNLTRQSRDPDSPLPATLAVDVTGNTVRVLHFKNGRKKYPLAPSLLIAKKDFEVPWAVVGADLSDDEWREALNEANKMKREVDGAVLEKDRETGFITVNDEQGRVLWMNDVARDYYDGLSSRYKED